MNQEQYKSKQNQIAKLQEEVNTYEQRQNKIKEYKKQMNELIKSLVQHKFFYIDNTIVFVGFGYTNTGLTQGLLHGVAQTSSEDKYEKDLGQIIAVFRAFGKPVGKVIKLVERKDTPKLYFGNGNGKVCDNHFIINGKPVTLNNGDTVEITWN